MSTDIYRRTELEKIGNSGEFPIRAYAPDISSPFEVQNKKKKTRAHRTPQYSPVPCKSCIAIYKWPLPASNFALSHVCVYQFTPTSGMISRCRRRPPPPPAFLAAHEARESLSVRMDEAIDCGEKGKQEGNADHNWPHDARIYRIRFLRRDMMPNLMFIKRGKIRGYFSYKNSTNYKPTCLSKTSFYDFNIRLVLLNLKNLDSRSKLIVQR